MATADLTAACRIRAAAAAPAGSIRPILLEIAHQRRQPLGDLDAGAAPRGQRITSVVGKGSTFSILFDELGTGTSR